MQQDTLGVINYGQVVLDAVTQRPGRPQTPYQVLRLLPKDATPAQQDSAIQAWFQPAEIRYSEQPDTLHLPGQGPARDLKQVNLPKYYRESFFANDSLYRAEITGGRYGVAGDPVPYSVQNDNVITSLLLGSFVISMIGFAISRNFIIRQLKYFFYASKDEQMMSETSNEMRFQLFFVFNTALMISLIFFFYVRDYVADTFILSDEYMLIGVYFGLIIGYYILKMMTEGIVNLVFWNGKRNVQWTRTSLFLTSLLGIFLFPSVLLYAYFDIQLQSVIIYALIMLVLVKILAFYKCFVIFFRQNGYFLQIILYFCALEIVPLFALWGGLTIVTNALKINF